MEKECYFFAKGFLKEYQLPQGADQPRQQPRQHIKKQRHYFADKGSMTNLDSVLKGSDITLPTKVGLVKAMVFPVVMNGCESRTVKKSEC